MAKLKTLKSDLKIDGIDFSEDPHLNPPHAEDSEDSLQDGDQQTSTQNMSEVNAEYLLSGGYKGEMD